MKKGVFVVLFGLLATIGSASVARAAEGNAPLVRFDASLVEAMDCADARAVATDFSSRQATISIEDAHAAARAFIACERTRRSDLEKTNLMRVLAAASLVVAANAENDGAQQNDLSAAHDVLKRVQRFSHLTYGHVVGFVGHLSARGGNGEDRFERVESTPPTNANTSTGTSESSLYDPVAAALLAAIETLKK
jgi:hypothetical protein